MAGMILNRVIEEAAAMALTQRLIDEVEVVVQAFARVPTQIGLAAGLVVPRAVAGAGFHGRQHMHQSNAIPAFAEHALYQ